MSTTRAALRSASTRSLVLLFLFAASVSHCLPAAEKAGLKVHMLSGSKEYKSEPSLKRWAQHLKKDHGIEVTMTHAADKAKSAEGLENLAQADVLVVFCRRWQLSGAQAEHIKKWIRDEKPILGIRTASHAFEFAKTLDKEVFGGDYKGHHKAYVDMGIAFVADSKEHPILKGLKAWKRKGKLYWNRNPQPDIKVLIKSVSDIDDQPLAWTRETGKRRVFYTSMGTPDDFENPAFIQLLDNALLWCVGQSDK